MTDDRTIITQTLVWQGITIEISFEPNWLNLSTTRRDDAPAHLQLRSLSPERAPLPVTETGYRSHFLHPSEVAEAGGPAAYVRAWLDHMAQSREWKTYAEQSRQLSLF